MVADQGTFLPFPPSLRAQCCISLQNAHFLVESFYHSRNLRLASHLFRLAWRPASSSIVAALPPPLCTTVMLHFPILCTI